MNFEKFIAKKGKFTPQVTINRSGGLGLSSGMHHRYKLDNYMGVELYFDKEAQVIGIKLVEKESEGMFKLKKRPDEKGAYFSARSFLASYSIDPQKYAGRYSPEEIEDPNFGKLFVIKLIAKT